jgi:hypothetical protein
MKTKKMSNKKCPAGPPQGKFAPSRLKPAAPHLLERVRTGEKSEASGKQRSARCSALREAFSKSGEAKSMWVY